MTHLDSVAWPPEPIRTERLVLRAAEARDRDAMINLFSSAQVNEYAGGGEPREQLEAAMPAVPGSRPGFFVVELDGSAIGLVTFDPRDAERPGHVRPGGGESELGYLLLPHTWGNGYATEACTAAMAWFARALPDQPLVISTQLANERSLRLIHTLGFAELDRFTDYGTQQWFGASPQHGA